MTATVMAETANVPFDPFELKDTVSGDIRDPYPRMHELRQQAPVHSGPVDLGDGLFPADPHKPPSVTVFGFDEVVQVLKDNETYSSGIYEGVMGEVMGRTILQMDEPEHRISRALVSTSFRSKVLARWEEELVAVVVNELIDSFVGQGRADLVREVTFNFPAQVIAHILGLPRADYPQFQRWAIELNSVAANWERGVAASVALGEYFAAVMEERRITPGDDLISDLVTVEVEGSKLTDEEIYSFLRLILPAGVETTYRATGNLLLALLSDRAQFDALYNDRSLFPQAFEEALRWEPPVTVILRQATRDTELGGVRRRRRCGSGTAPGRGKSGRPQVRRPRPLRHVPRSAPARRFRIRRPRVPRHAPGPHGVACRHEHSLRSTGTLHVGSRRAGSAH